MRTVARRGTVRSGALGAVAVLVAVAVTGCGSSGGGTAASPAKGPGAVPSKAGSADGSGLGKAFTPPLKFASASVQVKQVTLNAEGSGLPVALVGTTAYVGGATGLAAVDTRTGSVVATIPALGPKSSDILGTTNGVDNVALPSVGDAPVVVASGSGTVVLTAFVEGVPGQGTTQGHDSVELLAVDPATNKTAWTTTIDSLPSWLRKATGGGSLAVGVVAVSGSTAVLVATDGHHVMDEDVAGIAVDLNSHHVLWTADRFVPMAVVGGTVVGETDTTPGVNVGAETSAAGRRLSDGTQVWKQMDNQESTYVSAAGPTHVVLSGTPYSGMGGKAVTEWVDAATGQATPIDPGDAGQGNGVKPQLGCQYDGVSTVVCQGNGNSQQVLALDATTGKILWQLPDTKANRTAPTVSDVWQGAVYGTTSNGPVVLDARTGADRQDAPGMAPNLVDGYVGLSAYAGGVTAQRAIG